LSGRRANESRPETLGDDLIQPAAPWQTTSNLPKHCFGLASARKTSSRVKAQHSTESAAQTRNDPLDLAEHSPATQPLDDRSDPFSCGCPQVDRERDLASQQEDQQAAEREEVRSERQALARQGLWRGKADRP